MSPSPPTPVGAWQTFKRGFWVIGQGIKAKPTTFFIAVAVSGLYGIFTTAGGWLLGRITDQTLVPVFRGDPMTAWDFWRAGLLMLAIATLTSLAVAGRRIIAGYTTVGIITHYRSKVLAQFQRLPMSWHHRHPTGQLLANAGADVDSSFNVFNPLPMACGVLIMAITMGVAMVIADPVLGLVGFSVVPLLILISTVFQRVLVARYVAAQGLRGEVSGVAHESFDAALIVKALGRENYETQKFRKVAHELRDAQAELGRLSGIYDALMEALPGLGGVAVVCVGSYRVLHGYCDTGDVVQVAYMLQLLGFPIRAFGWVFADLPNAVVGFNRVSTVLNARSDMPFGDATLPTRDVPASLALSGVGYVHPSSTIHDLATDDDDEKCATAALCEVSVDVPAGRTVAVVGPTGSGKTTLVNVILRLVDPTSGNVLIDGVNLRELQQGELAQHAGLAAQSTFLFESTIRDNVLLGADLPDEAVWQALHLARAEKFVSKLSGGLDAKVGERGSTLSGGQRQRLALARVLIRQPRLLVLDDAASALDPDVEQQVLAGLKSAAQQATVVLIAYRRASIALADEIIFMDQGRVLDRGSHEELEARQPKYRQMVRAYDTQAPDDVRSATTEVAGV